MNEAFSFSNLYKSYLLCRRGKRDKAATIRYEVNALENTYRLAHLLRTREYKIGKYNLFYVNEPKRRVIMALPFEHRVVQYCLCKEILEPAIERHLIFDTYACRRGKGTHAGLLRLEHFLKKHYRQYGPNGYIVKGDIATYFHSIGHAILKQKMYPMVDESIHWLLDQIIDSTESPGIPLGNQTSQWFANLYLSSFDHYIKEKLRVKYYLRYMDDWVAVFPTKEEAVLCLEEMKQYLKVTLKLQVNNKTQLFPIKNGIDFLGFNTRLTETGKVVRKVRRKSKQNIKRKLKKFKKLYAADKITKEGIDFSYQSWLGHASHGDCYRLTQSMNEYYAKIFKGDGGSGTTTQ